MRRRTPRHGMMPIAMHIGRVAALAFVLAMFIGQAHVQRTAASGPTAPSVVTYAADTFSRTVSGGWGTADTGGDYVLDGATSAYSVNGSAAGMSLTAGASSKLTMLTDVSALDTDMTFRVQTNKKAAGGSQYVWALTRKAQNGLEYRGQIRFDPSGRVGLQMVRVDNYAETPIGSEVIVPGLPVSANQWLWVRVQAVGASPTTLRLKAWADGQAEPAGWAFVGTDNDAMLQEAGTVGFRAYVASSSTAGTVQLSFDDLLVTSVGPPANIVWQPYLQQLSATSVIVLWATWSGGAPAVDYGVTPSLGLSASGTSRPLAALGTQLHRVALTGLQPDTTYAYRISNAGTDQLPDQTLSFHTAPVTGSTTPFRFLAFGDFGNNTLTQRLLRDQMLGEDARFFFSTGDNAYDAGRYQDFGAAVFPIYRDLFARLGVFPTLGNHDYETSSGAPYLDLFDLPQQALRGGDQERYYSFDFGNAHLVALDSNTPLDAVDAAATDDMFDWLRQDLAQTAQRWKIVAFHFPAYSTATSGGSNPEVQAKLVPIFEQYGVDLVLNGHDHYYMRSKPLLGGNVTTAANGGITYVVTGSGDRDTADCTSASWVAFQLCNTGSGLYSRISLNNNQITVEGIGASGAVLDSASWTKGAAQPTSTPTSGPSPTATSTPTPSATPTSTSTPSPYIAYDTFSRTTSASWGAANIGGAYSIDPAPSDFSVNGTMGRMTASAGASSKLAELPAVSARDVDMLLRLQTDRLASGDDQYAYLTTRRVSGGNEYRGQVRFTPSQQIGLQLRKTVSWTETALGSEVLAPGLSHVANSFIWVRMQVVGAPTATLRMKAWADGQPEPAAWQTVATDSAAQLQGPGDVGLRAYVGSSSTAGAVTFGFDDLQVINPAAATPTPTAQPTATNTALPTSTNTALPTATNTALPTTTNTPLATATNTALPTATSTPQPTATGAAQPTATNTTLATATNTAQPTATFTALPTSTGAVLPTATNTPSIVTYASDTFGRVVAGGWGAADAGGTYVVDPAPSDFSVNGTMGRMTASAGASSKLAELPAVSARDVDMLLRLQTDRLATGNDQDAYLITRRVSGGSEYRGMVRFHTTGQIGLRIDRMVSWTATTLGSEVLAPGLSHVANSFIWVRMQVVGAPTATLRMKAWADGQPEPAAWQTVATDSAAQLQGPGDVGLRAYVGSSSTAGAVTFGFDDLLVTSPSGVQPQGRIALPPVKQPGSPTPAAGVELAPNDTGNGTAGPVYIPFAALSPPSDA